MLSKDSVKAIFDLCRISNLPTVWTNVMAAIVLSGSGFSWRNFLILSLSMSFFYSGGMCLNDIMDVAIDRIKKPFRPITTGRVSIQNAYILTITLFVIALSLLLFVPYQTAIYTGFLLLAVIVAYDRLHNRHSKSIILMATCRQMVFVVSAIAVTGRVGFFVLIAGFIQFVYILTISLVAKREKNINNELCSFSIIPIMIACISLLDGIVMAVFVSPAWLIAGISGAVLTQFGQKYVRGD